jgi:precorrin-3B synthase
MNAPARASYRRGACPGLSAPMQTGDGLLLRLMPAGTIGLEEMAGLCAAARQHGNGVIEITARGSIQIRGLAVVSAAPFADAVARLGIATHDGVPVITDSLAGLDPDAVIDADALAAKIRGALAAQGLVSRLSPKVCVTIDGDGALHLDALSADVRLRAAASPDGIRLHVAIGGDAATAVAVGAIASARAVEMVAQLLDLIAAHGRDARARDIVRRHGVGAFRAAAGNPWIDPPPPATRPAAEPVGTHKLRAGQVAVGIGFAFGHTDASALESLLAAATSAGAHGLRAAAGRVLLVVGLRPDGVAPLIAAAGKLGFITDPGDPRRRVVACAGAPICGSGEIPARALGPQVAQAAAGLIGAGEVIHISGCAKGCAHRGAAALTAVGRAGQCDLLVDGAPAGSVAIETLPQDIARLARQRGVRHG